MGLLNTLTYAGKNIADFGVFIAGDGAYDSPEKVGETIHIPGRNGAMFLSDGSWENIEVVYPAFIGTMDENNFRTQMGALRAWMMAQGGYNRLEDTYHPDEYRLGIYSAAIETVPTQYNRAGSFELIFNCKPQRFLKSGDEPITLTQNTPIYNPTLFNAKPIIKVVGNGTVTIEPYQFTVTDNDGELWIDSELMDVYYLVHTLYNLTDENLTIITEENGINIEVSKEATPIRATSKVSFANYVYPEIVPEYVPVKFDQTITELTIYPRWWTL